MINSENFAKRLQKIIDFYGETSSSFAEKIGVQRSSISHILSGRNKPSLDFVLKILSSFPEVEMYWLLNGKGTFPTISKQESSILPQTNRSKETDEKGKTIKRIVIFYSDGSFENFEK
ncbi:MAG: helix-turn-helix transcriptional regulator [Flavobacteriaceae bacterium]|jgi:transcriptional regulator with XRE-family HTH domain